IDSALSPGIPPAANACQAAKLKAAGKKAKCLLGLEAKEASSGEPKDPAKVTKCKDKLSSSFEKAETKPPCLTSDDFGPIETQIDNLVDDVDAEANPDPSCAT